MMMVMRVGSENVCMSVVLILLVLGEGRGFLLHRLGVLGGDEGVFFTGE